MKRVVLIISVVAILAVTAIGIWPNSKISELVTHGQSQVGHNLALQNTFTELRERLSDKIPIILGKGLGTSGPIAFKYGGIISESWYLQIILEIGILGLLLWLASSFFILKQLFARKELGLFFGFIAVLITALFLHTFADNLVLSYSLFMIIGAVLADNNIKGRDEKNSN